jgi:hypothetical protein
LEKPAIRVSVIPGVSMVSRASEATAPAGPVARVARWARCRRGLRSRRGCETAAKETVMVPTVTKVSSTGVAERRSGSWNAGRPLTGGLYEPAPSETNVGASMPSPPPALASEYVTVRPPAVVDEAVVAVVTKLALGTWAARATRTGTTPNANSAANATMPALYATRVTLSPLVPALTPRAPCVP